MASSEFLKKLPRDKRYHQTSFVLPITDGALDQPEEFIGAAIEDMFESLVDPSEPVTYARVSVEIYTKIS